ICCGNYAIPREEPRQLVEAVAKAKGNFRMCERPTNPIDYLIENFAGKRVWRFVLTHPDMDHLDGFNALMDRIGIDNFWDSGVRKEKPDFEGSGYLEEDWDRYVRVRDGHEPGVNVLSPLAGATFKYANEDDEGKAGDALTICSPDRVLVDEANANGDTNDASYVVRYYSAGGKIIIPGDAHDKTWNF